MPPVLSVRALEALARSVSHSAPLSRYHFRQQLGAGANGTVYLATTRISGRDVPCAVKVQSLPSNDMDRRTLLREVKCLATAGAELANVVGHYESFSVEGLVSGGHVELLFIVTEYMGNGDLAHLIEQRTATKEYFAETDIWLFVTQLAMGLKQLHEARVVHRDIKPANVLLDRCNNLHLGDLGLGAGIGADGNATATVALCGTPLYMAPELAEGRPHSAASDVWGLGCILFELMALQHAFNASNQLSLVLAVCKRSTTVPVSSLRDRYSAALVGLVDRCLAVDPAARPTAAEIVSDLHVSTVRRAAKRVSEAVCRGQTRPVGPGPYVFSDVVAELLALGPAGRTAAAETSRMAQLPRDKLDKLLDMKAELLSARRAAAQRAEERAAALDRALGEIAEKRAAVDAQIDVLRAERDHLWREIGRARAVEERYTRRMRRAKTHRDTLAASAQKELSDLESALVDAETAEREPGLAELEQSEVVAELRQRRLALVSAWTGLAATMTPDATAQQAQQARPENVGPMPRAGPPTATNRG